MTTIPKKSAKSSAKSASAQPKTSSEMQASTIVRWNVIGSILFVVYAYFSLAVCRGDMLFRGQELSLFLFEKTYFIDMISEPAGLLEYLGNFLTQFFYYPWLGSLLFVLLLCVLQYLVYKAFRMKKSLYLFSWIPSACLLLYVTQVEYNLYVTKSDDIFYLHLLGAMSSLIPLLMAPKRLRNKFRVLFFYLIIGYPLFGFYALLGALLMIISELNRLSHERVAWIFLVFGVIFTALIPMLYYALYHSIAWRFVYIYGLPFMNYIQSGWMWLPLILCYLSLLSFSVFFLLPFKWRQDLHKMPFNLLVVPFCLLIVYLLSYRDSNFDTQLAMERAIAHDDWKEVLTIAKKDNPTPNRILILYRNMALWKESQLCDKMFTFPNGSEKLHTKNQMANQTIVAAPVVPFYYGLLNYCYRWNMENSVLLGPSVQNYKYMMMCSFLKGEKKLAERYAGKLQETLFYKKWANDQMACFNSEQVSKNPVYKDILSLMCYNNQLGMEESIMERTLWRHFRSFQSGSKESLDLVMASVLTTKDVESFWPIFFVYVWQNSRIPVHVQEAALLFAFFEKRDLTSYYPKMDALVRNRFSEYLRMVEQNKHLSEDLLGEKLKPKYQKTYWYYFNFVSDLNAN